jgi:hypothetical protein
MVEEVTRWKSKDGQIHDSKVKAENADRDLEFKIEESAKTIVAEAKEEGRRILHRRKKNRETGAFEDLPYIPLLIMVNTKYGRDFYSLKSREGAKRWALELFKERNENGYYFDEWGIAAKQIIEEEDGVAAYGALMLRGEGGGDYERVEPLTVETYD